MRDRRPGPPVPDPRSHAERAWTATGTLTCDVCGTRFAEHCAAHVFVVAVTR